MYELQQQYMTEVTSLKKSELYPYMHFVNFKQVQLQDNTTDCGEYVMLSP